MSERAYSTDRLIFSHLSIIQSLLLLIKMVMQYHGHQVELQDLKEVRRKEAADGSFILVYLGDGVTPHQLELTWLRDWEKDHYDLGDNEFHLAFRVDDFEAAHAKHKEMGCICFENEKMGIYFITDPDNYWLEIVPTRK